MTRKMLRRRYNLTDPQATVSVSVTGIASNGFISRTEWAISACSLHGTVSVNTAKANAN